MSFRIQSISLFLTYPQCDVPKEVLLAFLQSIAQIDKYCIGQEKHEDGNLHLHAFIKWKKRLNTTNERIFDCNGFHPNIQTPRNTKAVIEYCKKEDTEPLTNITEKLQYGDIFEKATTKDEFMALVLEHQPRDYALFYERLESMARNHYKPVEVEYTPRYTNFINVPIELLTLDLIQVGDRPKSIVILGPRGLGKTEWARSHGPHLYSRGAVIYDDILRDREGSKYAVFDDLWEWNFRFLKDFLGGQPTATITGKYRKPKLLDWGIRSIFLTNEKFWEEWTPKQKEYFFDSTILIELSNKLY